MDDQDYADECYELVKQLEVKNLEFTGRVNVVEYMRKLDFTVRPASPKASLCRCWNRSRRPALA